MVKLFDGVESKLLKCFEIGANSTAQKLESTTMLNVDGRIFFMKLLNEIVV